MYEYETRRLTMREREVTEKREIMLRLESKKETILEEIECAETIK